MKQMLIDDVAVQAEVEKDFSIHHMADSLKQLVQKTYEDLTALCKEEKDLKEISLE